MKTTDKEKQTEASENKINYMKNNITKFQEEMDTDYKTAQQYLQNAGEDYNNAVEQFQEDKKLQDKKQNKQVLESGKSERKKKQRKYQDNHQYNYQNQIYQQPPPVTNLQQNGNNNYQQQYIYPD
ncbi:Hypothetical_protein [Hexamita inflata]|uniref:Hypothetical_protein n=1 Tax=Hexamita inflata TaxID=28002 RepID=A0AA86RJ09_9EUKA|nr:Hypothetical protein HINF_LOCUS60684 [Hexamita inflata]